MSSDSFLDMHQTVGYKPGDQALVVCLSAKMANQMKKDGWEVGFDKDIGHYVRFQKEE